MYLGNEVYGALEDLFYVSAINAANGEYKKKIIKDLWEDDPVKYAAWKQWCMEEGELSDIFGTLDDPIEIDESKL